MWRAHHLACAAETVKLLIQAAHDCRPFFSLVSGCAPPLWSSRRLRYRRPGNFRCAFSWREPSNDLRLSRSSRLSTLLRGRRLRSATRVRARAGRQPLELVAAGSALPGPLHLRDICPSRVCAFELPPRRPRSGGLCGRRCGADRSPRRGRRAHRGAIDGRLVCGRLRAQRACACARAGARLDGRRDHARASAVRRSAADAGLGAEGGRRHGRDAGEQHPRRGRRAHGARAAGRALSLSGDRRALRDRQLSCGSGWRPVRRVRPNCCARSTFRRCG